MNKGTIFKKNDKLLKQYVPYSFFKFIKILFIIFFIEIKISGSLKSSLSCRELFADYAYREFRGGKHPV